MAVLVCRVVFQVFPLTQLPPRTDCQTVIEPLQLAFKLIDEEQNNFNRYPGVKFGSMDSGNNEAGNWE